MLVSSMRPFCVHLRRAVLVLVLASTRLVALAAGALEDGGAIRCEDAADAPPGLDESRRAAIEAALDDTTRGAARVHEPAIPDVDPDVRGPLAAEGQQIARTQARGVARDRGPGSRLLGSGAWHAGVEGREELAHEPTAVAAALGRFPTEHVPPADLRAGEGDERITKRSRGSAERGERRHDDGSHVERGNDRDRDRRGNGGERGIRLDRLGGAGQGGRGQSDKSEHARVSETHHRRAFPRRWVRLATGGPSSLRSTQDERAYTRATARTFHSRRSGMRRASCVRRRMVTRRCLPVNRASRARYDVQVKGKSQANDERCQIASHR